MEDNKPSLKHWGIKGMRWGVRKAHSDHGDIRTGDRARGSAAWSVGQDVARSKAVLKGATREQLEAHYKVAQQEGMIKQRVKTAKELSTKQLKAIVGKPEMQEQFAKIDAQSARNAKLLTAGIVAAYGALWAASYYTSTH